MFGVVFEKLNSSGTSDKIPVWNNPWIQHSMALQPPAHANIAFQNVKVVHLLMSHDKC